NNVRQLANTGRKAAMKMTIGKRVIFGFVSLIAICIGIGLLAYVNLRTIRANAVNITDDCLPGESISGDLQSTCGEVDRLLLRHLSCQTKAEKDAVSSQINKLWDEDAELYSKYEKTIFTEQDRSAFNNVTTARDDYRKGFEEVLALSNDLKNKEAFAAYEKDVMPAFDRYVTAAHALGDLNSDDGETGGREIATAVSHALTAVITGNSVAMLVGLVLAF